MARARDPNRDKAYEIYKAHNGDIKLKDIAEQLGISEGTVRGWKNKDKWDLRLEEESNGTFQSKQPKNTERSVKKKPKRNTKKNATKQNESKATVSYELVPSDGLNEKQLLFCMYYTKYWNATKAYQKVYECDYRTAMASGSRLLRNVKVREEIHRLKAELANGIMLSARDVLQKYIDIAFADITDYVTFGTVEERAFSTIGEPLEVDGEPVMYKRTYVVLNESAEIDGTILTEVKKGKDGVSVKLADKMAALNMLARYTDLLDENTRKQLQTEQSRLNIEKTQSEITKIRAETKGNHGPQTSTVDLSNLTIEELRALAKRNK
ncbi:terminase small subunit [Lysinibacillus sp. KU-BSD001]|uniref:terminase small subunit n=1 Tax=Lysinibacillus sp. KU-BSD001 TaxID=3141328 RepID=UPI0036EF4B72